ncbi:MAG: rod shape-determining protein MreD [Anaerolineales bacterium]
MTYVIGIPFIALLAVLQTSLVSHLRLLEGRPDLVLLAIVAWALTGKGHEAMILGFAGGLFLDAFSTVPLGVSSAALVMVAAIVSYSEGQFWGINPIMQLAAVLVSSVVFYAVIIFALVTIGQPVDLQQALSRIVLPSLFVNLILALPTVQIGESLHGVLHPPRVTA